MTNESPIELKQRKNWIFKKMKVGEWLSIDESKDFRWYAAKYVHSLAAKSKPKKQFVTKTHKNILYIKRVK